MFTTPRCATYDPDLSMESLLAAQVRLIQPLVYPSVVPPSPSAFLLVGLDRVPQRCWHSRTIQHLYSQWSLLWVRCWYLLAQFMPSNNVLPWASSIATVIQTVAMTTTHSNVAPGNARTSLARTPAWLVRRNRFYFEGGSVCVAGGFTRFLLAQQHMTS